MTARRVLPALLSVSLVLSSLAWAQSVPEPAHAPVAPGGEVPVSTQHAMVVSVHHLATDAGVAMLREGGNAVDAAVATGFALAVVFPFAGNLGGGGFMLIHLQGGKNTFIDYREEAPAKASRDMYLDKEGNVIPGASTVGYKAIAVPGTVAGLAMAERKYGRLGLAKVMAPALRLAADGFALMNADEAHFYGEQHLADFPESRRLFTHNGAPLRAGDVLKQPELARTLARIAADPGDFYHGEIARTLVADLQRGGGLMTMDDLAHYQARERVPLEGSYEGLTVVSAPPPSSGGAALIETLNILAGYNLQRLGDRTPASMHLVVEAFRRAYMDRNAYGGDPDFTPVPVKAMTEERYAAAWRASIRDGEASPSASLQRPAGFLPPVPGQGQATPGREGGDTTHYSVVDEEGNAVAVTTTLNGGFGSCVAAEGLGFVLNDEMDDFTAKPGVPNMFGLIQGGANAIAGGKRPLSSMTPTVVLSSGGKVRYVLGTPGGGRITTMVALMLLGVVDGGLNIQEAVDAPRFHHQFLPDVVYLERGFSPGAVEGLRAMGYTLDTSGEQWGDGECIAVDEKTGALEAGQDHRHSFGKAAGY